MNLHQDSRKLFNNNFGNFSISIFPRTLGLARGNFSPHDIRGHHEIKSGHSITARVIEASFQKLFKCIRRSERLHLSVFKYWFAHFVFFHFEFFMHTQLQRIMLATLHILSINQKKLVRAWIQLSEIRWNEKVYRDDRIDESQQLTIKCFGFTPAKCL